MALLGIEYETQARFVPRTMPESLGYQAKPNTRREKQVRISATYLQAESENLFVHYNKDKAYSHFFLRLTYFDLKKSMFCKGIGSCEPYKDDSMLVTVR